MWNNEIVKLCWRMKRFLQDMWLEVLHQCRTAVGNIRMLTLIFVIALRKDSNAMEVLRKAILGLALSIVWDSIQHLGKCITMRKFSILNIPIIIVSQIAEQCQRFCFILLPIYFIHPLYLGKGKVREGERGACYLICWPTAFDCCEAWGYFLH